MENKITGAAIVIGSYYRRADNSGYDLMCERLTTPFPVEDDEINALIINQEVEKAVLKAPEQYWWLHRRFKTRPPGEPYPY